MQKKKAVCVVAHPDDCIIFARPFIYWTTNFDWTILYLTYNEHEGRAREIKNFWNKRSVATEFLGYVDDYRDMESGQLSFDSEEAGDKIIDKIKDFDLVVTHDQNGDYGHIHHVFVHNILALIEKAKVYFASQQSYNYTCEIKELIDYTEIPLHSEVVAQFENINMGYYFVTEAAMELINGNT